MPKSAPPNPNPTPQNPGRASFSKCYLLINGWNHDANEEEFGYAIRTRRNVGLPATCTFVVYEVLNAGDGRRFSPP